MQEWPLHHAGNLVPSSVFQIPRRIPSRVCRPSSCGRTSIPNCYSGYRRMLRLAARSVSRSWGLASVAGYLQPELARSCSRGSCPTRANHRQTDLLLPLAGRGCRRSAATLLDRLASIDANGYSSRCRYAPKRDRLSGLSPPPMHASPGS